MGNLIEDSGGCSVRVLAHARLCGGGVTRVARGGYRGWKSDRRTDGRPTAAAGSGEHNRRSAAHLAQQAGVVFSRLPGGYGDVAPIVRSAEEELPETVAVPRARTAVSEDRADGISVHNVLAVEMVRVSRRERERREVDLVGDRLGAGGVETVDLICTPQYDHLPPPLLCRQSWRDHAARERRAAPERWYTRVTCRWRARGAATGGAGHVERDAPPGPRRIPLPSRAHLIDCGAPSQGEDGDPRHA